MEEGKRNGKIKTAQVRKKVTETGKEKKKEARKKRAKKKYNRSKIAKVRLKEQHLQLRITL